MRPMPRKLYYSICELLDRNILTPTITKEEVMHLATDIAAKIKCEISDCYNAICLLMQVEDFPSENTPEEIAKLIRKGFTEQEAQILVNENVPDKVIEFIIYRRTQPCDPGFEYILKTWKHIGDSICTLLGEDIVYYVENALGLPYDAINYKNYGIDNAKGAYLCGINPNDAYACQMFKNAGEVPAFYKMELVLPDVILNILYDYDIINYTDKNIEKITLNDAFGVWAPLLAIIPAQKLLPFCTKKEAYEFFTKTKDMDITHEEKSIVDIYLAYMNMVELKEVIKNQKIFQWAKAHWNNADMTRQRRVYGPAGAVKDYTYREMVVYLEEEDIVSQSDSVERVFTRMNQRIEKKENEKAVENYRFPDPPYPGNEYIVHIEDYKTLAEVGKFMNNCARTYAEAIRMGKTTLYQVHDDNHNNATMEVANNKVYQLLGPKNTEPSNEIKEIVKKWTDEHNIEYKPWNL